jgi:hypothetical protein
MTHFKARSYREWKKNCGLTSNELAYVDEWLPGHEGSCPVKHDYVQLEFDFSESDESNEHSKWKQITK